MKIFILTVSLIITIDVYAQPIEVFKNIDFDSTYCIIGIGQNTNNLKEQVPDLTFIIDNPEELKKIKQEWVVTTIRPKISRENPDITIHVTKNKQLEGRFKLLYPIQGIINTDNHWYDFNSELFMQLIKTHPLKYHTQIFTFANQLDYAFFTDSIQSVPSFLFLFEPRLTYQGKFFIIAHRSPDPASPIFVLRDINLELERLCPSKKFIAQEVINDPFNLENTSKVKIRVECSKDLYDAYKSRFKEKSEWQPTLIQTKVFFRD